MIAERQSTGGEPNVQAVRKGLAARRKSWGPGPEVGQISEIQISTRGAPIRLHCYKPKGESPIARILFMHGGGWISGTIDDYDPFARAICFSTQCEVLVVDYRLAPEHPFPAALEDGEDALSWLAAEGGEIPLLIAGDSAGANLAAVIALTERGRALLRGQILLCPVTDCDIDSRSYKEYATGAMLSKAEMRWLWQQYVPDGQIESPRVSPLRTRSLFGAPPAWVVAAEFDVLRDDARHYVRKLVWHGVRARLSEYMGMTHNFAPMMNILDEAQAVLSEMGMVVRKMIAGAVF